VLGESVDRDNALRRIQDIVKGAIRQ
jgi:hypothetical protein